MYTAKIMYTAIKMNPMFIYLSKKNHVTRPFCSKLLNVSKKLLYNDSPLSLTKDNCQQFCNIPYIKSSFFQGENLFNKQLSYNFCDHINSVSLQNDVLYENSNKVQTKYFENCSSEQKMNVANKTYCDIDTTKDLQKTNIFYSADDIPKKNISHHCQSLESLMSFHIEEDSLYSISQDSMLSFSSEYYTLCFDSDDSKSSKCFESLELSENVDKPESEEIPNVASEQCKTPHDEDINNFCKYLNLEKDETRFENVYSIPYQMESLVCYDYQRYLKNSSSKDNKQNDIMIVKEDNNTTNLLILENSFFNKLYYCMEWFLKVNTLGAITTILNCDQKVIASKDNLCYLNIIKCLKENMFNKSISGIIVKCKEESSKEKCISVNFHLTDKFCVKENAQLNHNDGQKLILCLQFYINKRNKEGKISKLFQNKIQPWSDKRLTIINLYKLWELNDCSKENDEGQVKSNNCTVTNKSYNAFESKVSICHQNIASLKYKNQCLNNALDIDMENSTALGTTIFDDKYRTSETTCKFKSEATNKPTNQTQPEKNNCWKAEECDNTTLEFKSISKDSVICNAHIVDTYFFDGSNSFAILHDDGLTSSNTFQKYENESTSTDNQRESYNDECPTLHLPSLVESNYCVNPEEHLETVNTFVQSISFYPMSFNTSF